jgi:uncharacterized protein (TIRG00374 family)
MDWRWAALAVAFDILSYVCQGWRWKLLLQPLGEIRLLRTTQAIYVGLFANEVFPMRVGELARLFLVSRWIGAPFAAVFPSLAVERFFDGVWLAFCIGLTAMFIPLPRDLLRAGDALGAAVLLASAVFLYVVLRRRARVQANPSGDDRGLKPVRFLKTLFHRLEDGLHQIGLSASFWGAFALSLAVLLCQIIAFWLTMLACGLDQSFWVGSVVLLVVHLGTAVPNAPANLGTYQLFTVVGLSLFGVDKATATGFSFVVFFLLTAPLWLIGFVALSRSGATMRSLRAEVVRLAA